MKTLLRAVVAFTAFWMAGPASAASIDLENTRCKNVTALHEDDALLLYFWLDGYLRRDQKLPVLDLEAAANTASHVADFCANHPDAPLREALALPRNRQATGK